MTSRIVFLSGWSRSRRRSATVTSSEPDASSAASMASSLVYLPVPRNSRERNSTPATTKGSACVTVCTLVSLPSVPKWWFCCRESPPGGFAADLPASGEVNQCGGSAADGEVTHPVVLLPRVPTRRLCRRPPHEWGGE